jgi:hypothetical protein
MNSHKETQFLRPFKQTAFKAVILGFLLTAGVVAEAGTYSVIGGTLLPLGTVQPGAFALAPDPANYYQVQFGASCGHVTQSIPESGLIQSNIVPVYQWTIQWKPTTPGEAPPNLVQATLQVKGFAQTTVGINAEAAGVFTVNTRALGVIESIEALKNISLPGGIIHIQTGDTVFRKYADYLQNPGPFTQVSPGIWQATLQVSGGAYTNVSWTNSPTPPIRYNSTTNGTAQTTSILRITSIAGQTVAPGF